MSRQVTTKSGKKSSAQKEADARNDYETRPAARPVAGATGKSGRSARSEKEKPGAPPHSRSDNRV